MTKPLHACAWASHKGRELKLSCPERVTLWQIAERAATKGFCFPSLDQLMEDTGLARATLVLVLRALAALGLIRVEKKGRRHYYYPALPVQNKTGHQSKSEPHRSSEVNRQPVDKSAQQVQKQTANGSKTSANGSDLNSDRFKIATLTLKEPKKEPAPPSGDAAHAGVREPQIEVLDSGKKEDAAPPPAPSNAYRPPGGKPDPSEGGEDIAGSPPTRGSYVDVLRRRLDGKRTLHCDDGLDTAVSEDTPVSTPEDRQRMAAQLAALVESLSGSRKSEGGMSSGGKLTMKAYPPGYGPVRDRWDQLDACKPQLRDVTLKGKALAQMRQAIANRRAA